MANSLMKKFEMNPELLGAELYSTLASRGPRVKPSRWTKAENQSLIEGIREHGSDYKKIAETLTTRDL